MDRQTNELKFAFFELLTEQENEETRRSILGLDFPTNYAQSSKKEEAEREKKESSLKI